MKKRRRLESLIDREFAEGFEGFRELVDLTNDPRVREAMPAEERASVRLMELIHVAMVEGVNECVEDYGLDDITALALVWHVTGMSLACLNAQAFTTCLGAVRKEMRDTLQACYDETAKSIAGGQGGRAP